MSPRAAAASLDLAALRQDFPILNRPLPGGLPLVYLDNAATTQKPRVMIDKIVEYYESYNSNTHRSAHALAERATAEVDAVREALRAFIGAAEPEEIVFTAGTTAAINLVAAGWGRRFLNPGDEVLLNEMEHHANFVPWQQVASERGAVVNFVPLTPDGRFDMAAYDQLLSPRTRLVALTGMSNVLGTVNPVGEMAARARAAGALVLVDGAQSVPHGPIDVRDAQVDFLTFSGHKLYGPTGVGVLYGRRDLLESMSPWQYGGNMIREVCRSHATFADLPAKFEAGTLPIAEIIGLGASLRYVCDLGWDAIHQHERLLTATAMDRLGQIPGLRIVGPGLEHRGSIVSFTVEGVHAHDLSEFLNRRGVAVRASHHCTMPLHTLLGVAATTRVSFAFYNTLEELDPVVDAITAAQKVFRRR